MVRSDHFDKVCIPLRAVPTLFGGSRGGLVVADLSTIDVQPNSSLTPVGGNAPDLFGDSNSFITGTANLAGVPTVNCGNLLSGNTVPLP
jgi:hypothetical protein